MLWAHTGYDASDRQCGKNATPLRGCSMSEIGYLSDAPIKFH